ncbi:arginase [Mycolicibacillus trivialis]|uniref:Arginase n=2 Tax=Mycolicibacillus trivialis TaxID=1798 RepID=A0A1X2EIS2_9MYCO|nr:arginase [Mycolicibacillus trivialis]
MRIHAVPQFQGAMTPRAPEMPDGCRALAELAGRVLQVPVTMVEQSTATSPREDGVSNRAILTGPNLSAQRAAIAGIEEPILTIGGDCGVEFEPIRVLRERFGAGLGVAWFDAHPDLKTPQTAHDGAYHAMVLAGLLGESDPALTAAQPVDRDKVALIGARGAIPAEKEMIARGMGTETDDPAAVLADATHVYVHVDVDVLDPSQFPGHNMPESDGLTIDRLVEMLGSLRGLNVVGAGITECVGTAVEVEVLTPVITALGALLRRQTD